MADSIRDSFDDTVELTADVDYERGYAVLSMDSDTDALGMYLDYNALTELEELIAELKSGLLSTLR